ncbi:MAG TPA: hypothetical protein VGK56_02315 [Anaerolineales bacterium]
MDYFEFNERRTGESKPTPDVIPWDPSPVHFEVHDTIIVEHGRGPLAPGTYPAVMREVRATGNVIDISWQLAH